MPLAETRKLIERAPDLLEHLAHLVTPGQHLGDGQPVARDVQSAPARLMPLDEIDAVFRELWLAADHWAGWEDREISVEHMVRRNTLGQVLGPAGAHRYERGESRVPVTPSVLRMWARALVERLLMAWPRLEGWEASTSWAQSAQIEAWCEEVDRWLGRTLARWPLEQRAPVPSRPRECPTCGEVDVFADAEQAAAVCHACKAVIRPERWVPVKDAAAHVGRDPSTIRKWITAGEVVARGTERKRMVELGMVEIAADLMTARERLGRALAR